MTAPGSFLRCLVGLLAGLVLVLTACQGGRDGTDAASSPTASSDTTGSPLDTRGTLPPSPAPGTAHVRGVIQACSTANDGATLTCRVRIDAVQATGPTTPVIGTGDRTVTVPSGVAKTWSANRLTQAGPVRFVLRAPGPDLQPPNAEASDAATPWMVTQVVSDA